MAEEQTKFDPKLEEGIAYFEKMLQVMPDDRVTLEFLCVAYEQIGEVEKQRKSLVSLSGILLKEGDLEAASSIGERLAQFKEPDAQAALLRIRAACRTIPPEEMSPEKPPVHDESNGTATHDDASAAQEVKSAVAVETKLLQSFVRDKLLDEDTANLLATRIADLAGAPGDFLISAIALLEKENSQSAEAAVAHLADLAGAPPIPLESFDLSGEILRILPESIMKVRGVMPFAKLGDTLLVATLNPMDDSLKHEIEAAAACPCRYYTAHPRVMEEILDRLFAERKDGEGTKEEP